MDDQDIARQLLTSEIARLRKAAEVHRFAAEELLRAAELLCGSQPTSRLVAVPELRVEAVQAAMSGDPPRTLVTVREAAAKLGLPEQRIRGWVDNSQVQRIQAEPGQTIYVVLEEVAARIRALDLKHSSEQSPPE